MRLCFPRLGSQKIVEQTLNLSERNRDCLCLLAVSGIQIYRILFEKTVENMENQQLINLFLLQKFALKEEFN